jgi:hypothetical protein
MLIDQAIKLARVLAGDFVHDLGRSISARNVARRIVLA